MYVVSSHPRAYQLKLTSLQEHVPDCRFRIHDRKLLQGWRTSYDGNTDGTSLSPSRGFGDLFFKQKRDADGNLHPAENQAGVFLGHGSWGEVFRTVDSI